VITGYNLKYKFHHDTKNDKCNGGRCILPLPSQKAKIMNEEGNPEGIKYK